MDVGRISNMNNMMALGRVNSPAESYASRANAPRASISNPTMKMPTHGSSALFFSSDGDFAEISNRAMIMSQIAPNAGVAAPVLRGVQGMPGVQDSPFEHTPVLTESGLLEELKPQGVCITCENRRYVDQSDDSSVSFQTPTSISPNMAAAAVASHEQEHVRNEQARAHREDREIVNQMVTLTYDTCPECGKQFVSGGTTRTTSISRGDDEEGFEGAFEGDSD
ncbi:MAG: hypothetical protein FWE83_00650 [Oscillospiraceae bacterium]|nr:hypothetical protein [Oscillospiraceae bacterium]